jgi:hypothetical protein
MHKQDLALLRTLASLVVMFLCAGLAHAQDAAALARELVTIKGGYADKKKHLEEVRIRAYIPILLKAVGKGPTWKPGHPNWAETERRIADEWRKLYVDYLARMGRDTSYLWMDDALAREYARTFSTDELGELVRFYRTAAGGTLLALEKEFLGFYPNDMLRSLARVMTGNETLSGREQTLLRAPENRARRDFVALFESESIIHDECIRISGYSSSRYPDLQQGAFATAAESIDALRRKVDAATLSDLQAFLKSDAGRKERIFLGAALPAVTPVPADPAQAAQEETAFYKGLAQLSAQWREVAAKSAAP